MGLEIASIENAQLRQAAETADTKGKHSNNGCLDKSELSIFKDEAANLCCPEDEIQSICKQVKAEHRAEKRYNKRKTLLAYFGAEGVILGTKVISKKLAGSMANISRGLTPEKVSIVNNAADEVLSSLTNLGKKGVKITDMSGTALQIQKPFLSKYLELLGVNAVANGKNAFYNTALKEVAINRETLSLATFHELGHAFNHNNSNFWSKMQILGGFSMKYIAPAIAVLPAFIKEEKPENGKELTFGQKLKNGFRKACPALAVASMLPVIAEEAMATTRANKWAKTLFSPELSKKVVKSNAFGLASYILLSVSLGLASYCAMKIKDKHQGNS